MRNSKKRFIFLNLLFLFFLRGLVFAEAEIKSEYEINAGDLLEIKVYEEPDLTKIVRVPENGKISFPFLGDIVVNGLTARELERKITELLARDYLVNPQVSVFLTEQSKQAMSVFVLGEVKTPGSYEMRAGLTLTQLIALTGGLNEGADTSSVKIIRGSDDKKETIEVNIERIINKADQDVMIKGGDTVVLKNYGRVSIMGRVVRPGVYPLKKGTTAADAVALAGGLSETAAGNSTTVIRVVNGQKRVIRIPLGSILQGGDKSRDIILEPDDTIVVPESFF